MQLTQPSVPQILNHKKALTSIPSWFNLSQASHRGLVEPHKVDQIADRRLIAIPCLGINCAQIWLPHMCHAQNIAFEALRYGHPSHNGNHDSRTYDVQFCVWVSQSQLPHSRCKGATGSMTVQALPPTDGLSKNILRYEMVHQCLSSVFPYFHGYILGYWRMSQGNHFDGQQPPSGRTRVENNDHLLKGPQARSPTYINKSINLRFLTAPRYLNQYSAAFPPHLVIINGTLPTHLD